MTKKTIMLICFSLLVFTVSCSSGGGDNGSGDDVSTDPDSTPSIEVQLHGNWEGFTSTDTFGVEQTIFNLTIDNGDISGTIQLTDSEGGYWETDNISVSLADSEATISAIFQVGSGYMLEYVYTGNVSDNTFSGIIDLFINGVQDSDSGTFNAAKESDQPTDDGDDQPTNNDGPDFKLGAGTSTFTDLMNGIAFYQPVYDILRTVTVAGSSGSVENLQKTNSGQFHMSMVYSGDVYLGLNGLLENDTNQYEDVLAVCYFYSAAAHLIVKNDSGINNSADLVGKRVSVGEANSSAALNSFRFFSHMGIQESIRFSYMNDTAGATAFRDGRFDAIWQFAIFPNSAATMAAQESNINLIDLDADAARTGFYDERPYFQSSVIPQGTYEGVEDDIPTFQESALWVTHRDVPDDVVYGLLTRIFTPKGLAYLGYVNDAAKAMSIENGATGILTPLHPGAEKFWKEKGVL